MAQIMFGLDTAELKMVRSVQRKQSLQKDREDYNKHLAKKELKANGHSWPSQKGGVPVSYKSARPHKASRAVTRSWLSQGKVQNETDMPTVSVGHPSFRKPSTSRVCFALEPLCKIQLDCLKMQAEWDDITVETDVPSDSCSDVASSVTTSPASSFCPDEPKLQESEGSTFMLDTSTSEDESISPCVEMPADDEKQPAATEPCMTADLEQEPTESVAPPGKMSTIQQGTSHQLDTMMKRESIMRDVMSKLREQALEAEQQAEEAQSRASKMEQELEAQHQKDLASNLKKVLQSEKQRAKQLRKQRNHAAQTQTIKEKAERALEEAAEIRKQTQNDAEWMQAQAIAEAARQAQQNAEAYLQAEILAAKAEAENLRMKSQEEAKQAQKLKLEAEVEADALKHQAEKEMSAAAEARMRAAALQAEAESIAKRTRDIAMQDAVALKARVEIQMQEKLEAAQKAHEDAMHMSAELMERSAAEATRHSEHAKQSARASALKDVKKMEQQRSRKMRKDADQERRQQQMMQLKADAIKREAEEVQQSIKHQALLEVEAMKAKAEAEVRAAQARAIEEARAEFKEKAEAESNALRAAAEREAEGIRAWAVREADLLIEQAKVESEKVLKSAVEAKEAASRKSTAETAVPEFEEWQMVDESAEESEDDQWDVL